MLRFVVNSLILSLTVFCLLAVGCSKTTDPEPLTPEEARRELAGAVYSL